MMAKFRVVNLEPLTSKGISTGHLSMAYIEETKKVYYYFKTLEQELPNFVQNLRDLFLF